MLWVLNRTTSLSTHNQLPSIFDFMENITRDLPSVITNEPRHEKTGFLYMRKQRRRSALRYLRADQHLCFCYIDSTIPLLPQSEILKPLAIF